ncbi:MAG: gliding motility-associated C-terminal domain-containing protein [Chitinophagia bacterium]|nr:gliding motility-associated C-terminal domain-containing protein [Chitinophagia bacterium]
MKRIILFITAFLAVYSASNAQLVSSNLFLQGRYVETGNQNNASFGSSVAVPSGYHTHSTYSICGTSGSMLAFVYEYGRDGWTVGSPPYMGDYTLPGSPWEGWAVEVNGATGWGYSTGSCNYTNVGGATLTGGMVSYTYNPGVLGAYHSSRAGQATGMWVGNLATGGRNLAIRQYFRVDTEAENVNITAVFTNTSSSVMNNVFYMRSCDPDNSQSWGGSFSTINVISYQNDADHRVAVTATATGSNSGSPACPMTIGTKDCRAKCLIYTSWPMNTSTRLFDVYYGMSTTIGTAYYSAQGSPVTSDIGICLVYNLGNIPAGDSAILSMAYIFNHYRGENGVDSAFPTPKLKWGSVINDSILTFSSCVDSSALNVEIIYGNDKGFSWSTWTWAPAIGLASTTGVTNTIDRGALTSSIVYTITSNTNKMGSCLAKKLYIAVNPAVSLPVVTNQTYCQYDTPMPLVATGTSLLWYTSATGGTGSPTPPIVSTATPGVFTYYVASVRDTCATPRVPLTVTVNAVPPPPTPTLQTYCQFDVASPVIATGMAGATLTWYADTARTGTTTAPTPSTGTPGVLNYYVTQTLAGCTSARAADPVTIIPKPNAPVTEDTSYCQYSPSARLTATGASLKWYTVPVGGTALSGAPTPPTTAVGNTTWFVSQTVSGCESDRTPLTVTILPLPDFTISTGKSYVCQYDTLTLAYTGSVIPGSEYHWTLPRGTSYISGDSSTPTIIVKFDSLYFQRAFLLTASSSGRCVTIDTVDIKVVPSPWMDAYVKENICAGDTITVALIRHSANAHNYMWNFDGATIVTAGSNPGDPYRLCWSTLDSGVRIVSLKTSTIEGCESITMYDTVKIHPRPVAAIGLLSQTDRLCLEDSVMLRAIVERLGCKYVWTPKHYFDDNEGSRRWGRIENAGFVHLHVTDPFGCENEDSLALSPESCCNVWFPNAFTPNGDRNNDVFKPVFRGYHRFSVFRVVNRWGQTVYEATNTNGEWDGTMNGVPQDLGVYYYFVKFDCDEGDGQNKGRIQKGEVILMR